VERTSGVFVRSECRTSLDAPFALGLALSPLIAPVKLWRIGMLCEKCHKQEAVLHVTVNWADSSVSKETNLCADCATASHGLERIPNLDAVLNGAPCRYCGGEPYSGAPDPISLLSGTCRISLMCKSCSEEYHRFLTQKWPGLGDVAITDEQIANILRCDIATVVREAEDYMKKWAADTNSK
jgi:protein-arginine kinase activator protein McsA